MEIKDYLHFYYDAILVKCPKQIGWPLSQKTYPLDLHFHAKHFEKNLVPILRKLSDMTEEELKQCVANEWGQTHTFTEHYCKKKISEISASAHGLYNFLSFYGTKDSLPYLLKQGFDLFGLIPAGLAIDKTSLKN